MTPLPKGSTVRVLFLKFDLNVHGFHVGNICIILQNNWGFFCSVSKSYYYDKLEFKNRNKSNNFTHTLIEITSRFGRYINVLLSL